MKRQTMGMMDQTQQHWQWLEAFHVEHPLLSTNSYRVGLPKSFKSSQIISALSAPRYVHLTEYLDILTYCPHLVLKYYRCEVL